MAGNAFFVEEGTVLCSAGSYLVKWNHGELPDWRLPPWQALFAGSMH